MASHIARIDRIKAIDVPWKIYLGLFIALSILMAVGCFLAQIYIKVDISILLVAMFAFIAVIGIIFSAITFLGVKQEEITDTKKLATLYNKIK